MKNPRRTRGHSLSVRQFGDFADCSFNHHRRKMRVHYPKQSTKTQHGVLIHLHAPQNVGELTPCRFGLSIDLPPHYIKEDENHPFCGVTVSETIAGKRIIFPAIVESDSALKTAAKRQNVTYPRQNSTTCECRVTDSRIGKMASWSSIKDSRQPMSVRGMVTTRLL